MDFPQNLCKNIIHTDLILAPSCCFVNKETASETVKTQGPPPSKLIISHILIDFSAEIDDNTAIGFDRLSFHICVVNLDAYPGRNGNLIQEEYT